MKRKMIDAVLVTACALLASCGDDLDKKPSPKPTNTNSVAGAPAFTNLPSTESTRRGESGAFDLAAIDPDDDPFTFGLVNTDCPFEVQVIATSGRTSWLCPLETLTCEAEITVSDDDGFHATDTLTIECVRPAPQISSTPPSSATEDDPVVYQVECVDPEGDEVTVTTGPDDTCGGSVDGASYRWTPNADAPTCMLSVTCSNGETSTTQSTEVSIRGVNQAPSASDVRINPSAPMTQGEVLTCRYEFADPDGDDDQSEVAWFVDGSAAGTGPTFDDYEAGESVVCRVTPFDGEDTGSPVSSAPVVFEWTLQVLTESEYSCVRTTQGGVRCWGHNRSGVIGSDQTGFRTVLPPTTPLGLTSNVRELATGYNFACAIQGDALKCWGSSSIAGQETHVPTTRLFGELESIDGGLGHACVVHDGAAKCWGANSAGQLGLGFANFTNVDDPTVVPGLETGVTKIVAGEMHTCAIRNGALYCWGSNLDGQLGVQTNFETFDDVTSPSPVAGLASGVTDVWAGQAFTCAMHSGTLKCFGTNGSGQLGRGSASDSDWQAAPATVVPTGFVHLSTGRNNTCFIEGGQARCVGLNNGVLLDFQGNETATPVTVFEPNVTAFDLSSDHACVASAGRVWCWGDNEYGQLGDGVGTGNSTPVGLTEVTF